MNTRVTRDDGRFRVEEDPKPSVKSVVSWEVPQQGGRVATIQWHKPERVRVFPER